MPVTDTVARSRTFCRWRFQLGGRIVRRAGVFLFGVVPARSRTFAIGWIDRAGYAGCTRAAGDFSFKRNSPDRERSGPPFPGKHAQATWCRHALEMAGSVTSVPASLRQVNHLDRCGVHSPKVEIHVNHRPGPIENARQRRGVPAKGNSPGAAEAISQARVVMVQF
jgi:hypothetical protein